MFGFSTSSCGLDVLYCSISLQNVWMISRNKLAGPVSFPSLFMSQSTFLVTFFNLQLLIISICLEWFILGHGIMLPHSQSRTNLQMRNSEINKGSFRKRSSCRVSKVLAQFIHSCLLTHKKCHVSFSGCTSGATYFCSSGVSRGSAPPRIGRTCFLSPAEKWFFSVTSVCVSVKTNNSPNSKI